MDKCKKVFLIRHGNIGVSYDGQYIGVTDVPLSPDGVQEARNIGNYLKKYTIGKVLASPLLRVRQTVAAALPENSQVEYNDSLREINFGLWETMTFTKISEQYPKEVINWSMLKDSFAFPEGEKFSDFRARVTLLKNMIMNCSEDTIAVFTHGGIILNLICNILELPLEKTFAMRVERGSISTLDLFPDGSGVLTGLNYKPEKL